jgi:hypothetical protein
MVIEFCPNCDLDLEEGEIGVGDTAYRFRYCDSCEWHGDITQFRLLRYQGGKEYWIDPTIVRPDIGLWETLKGRLHLTGEAQDKKFLGGPSRSKVRPLSPCPHCGAEIELHHDLCDDLSGYLSSWSCDACGFQGDTIRHPAPGIFTHTEGYRCICWRGRTYELTENQSAYVKKLHLACLAGTPDVHQSDLLKETAPTGGRRLRDSFKCANRELLGKLIVRGTRRGNFRLNL